MQCSLRLEEATTATSYTSAAAVFGGIRQSARSDMSVRMFALLPIRSRKADILAQDTLAQDTLARETLAKTHFGAAF